MCYPKDKMMIRLGAHLSIGNGYASAVRRIKEMGGNALQIFSASPRVWRRPVVKEKEIQEFKQAKKELEVDPVVFHSQYLINLAVDNQTSQHSITNLIWEMQLAAKMGIIGTVVHLGSYLKTNPQLGYQYLLKNISAILKEAPSNIYFIMENAAGNKVGQTLDELLRIILDLQDKRLRICWDTCHGFAAGVDLSTEEKLSNLLSIIDEKVGLGRLVLWHLNDSRDPFNSHRDRHANIGEGYIGLDTFRNIINHPLARKIPMIIETPGFAGGGPDKENLDILKSLIEK